MQVHAKNRNDIEYLYNYRNGKQPILDRKKDVRPEICNKIVENRADEIVSFKSGYLVGEPIQYVSRKDDEVIANKITQLNDYMISEDKASEDGELADWMHTCGTSFRMALPDADTDVEADEAPFEIYTLDPRNTFVVYQNALGNKPMMGVTYTTEIDDNLVAGSKTVFSVYTSNWYMEIENNVGVYKLTNAVPQVFGIPIIEYPLNSARLGAFEVVLPLLDAINTTESNRVDGVEQFIQALMLFHNVDISSEDFGKLREEGAIKFNDLDEQKKAEIKYLTAELNQDQSQTLVNHMYDTVLTICGMPNRNGGSSTSDTGTAVIYRDGWSAAESRAKKTETMWKKSENKFLRLVLRICRDMGNLDMKLSDVKTQFTRRNYENITSKAQVLVAMLNNPKIAPQLAFTYCGMFSDPNVAYQMSADYYKEEMKKLETEQKVEDSSNNDNSEDTDKSEDAEK